MYSGGQQSLDVTPSAILRIDQTLERLVPRLILGFAVGLRKFYKTMR
jgi:hypothetical protein